MPLLWKILIIIIYLSRVGTYFWFVDFHWNQGCFKAKKEGRIWGQAKAIKSFFSFFFLGDFLKQYALLGAAAKGEIKLYQPKVDVLD